MPHTFAFESNTKAMFINTISWQEFLTTAIYILIAYYTITLLLLYHQDIKSWVSNRKKNTLSNPPEAKANLETHTSIMGDIVEDTSRQPRITSTPADEILFNETHPDEELISETPLNHESLLIGSVADLLQDIKIIIEFTATNHTNNTESIAMLKTLLQRYPHLKNTPYQESINQFISLSAQHQFQLSIPPTEINSWWLENNNKN